MKKHQPLYRVILRDAWHVTWTHKSLWIFGFLAAFLQAANVIELFVRAFSRVGDDGATLYHFLQNAYPGASLAGVFGTIKLENLATISGSGLLMLGVLVAISLFLLWIFGGAEAALAIAVSKKMPTHPFLPKLFKVGRPFAWKLVGLHILSRLLLAALFLVITLPLFLVASETDTVTYGLAFLAFIIFVPLALIVSFMTIYAVAGMVVNREPFWNSVHAAWYLTRHHFLVSLETSFILFIVNIAGGILVVLFALLLAFPVSLLSLGALVTGSGSIIIALAVISLVLVFGLVLLVGAIISTFQITTWILLYKRFARPGVVSKILRIAHAIPRYFKTAHH